MKYFPPAVDEDKLTGQTQEGLSPQGKEGADSPVDVAGSPVGRRSGADKQQRLARIRAAKAELEAEAAKDPAELDRDGPGPSTGMQAKGKPMQARGFRQLLLRGRDKVRAEWSLICTAHNLLKLAGARA